MRPVIYRLDLWCLSLAMMSACALAGDGEELYVKCAVCHLPDGQGIPGAFPPLAERLGPFAVTPEGRAYLIMVVKAGMLGQINVAGGAIWGAMPAQILDDNQIASVLNHVITVFNHDSIPDQWPGFSGEEVSKTTQKHPGATGQYTAELRKQVPGVDQ